MKDIKLYYNHKEVLSGSHHIYLDTLFSILKELNYNVTKHVNYELNVDEDCISFIFFNYIPILVSTLGYSIGKTKIIFIHADVFFIHSDEHQYIMNEYCKINSNKIHILDYCSINIKYYKEKFPSLKCTYLPLFYNKYLEEMYNSHVIKKIK